MKKTISVLLTLAIVFSLSSMALADNYDIALPAGNIYDEAKRLESIIPNSEATVIDGMIHIVVDDPADVPWMNATIQANSERVTSVVSSKGGTFKDFRIPAFDIGGFFPYWQTYMTQDVVNAALIKKGEPSVLQWILDQTVLGVAYSKIAEVASAMLGFTISSTVVSLLAGVFLFVIPTIDYYSLKSAKDRSSTGKVSVVIGDPPNGYPTTMYTPWNNNICTTYHGYEAVWYEGEYAI